MITFITGRLEEAGQGYIVIDHNGMGYQLYVPASVYDTLPQLGEEIRMETYLQVREDGVALYGFPDRDYRVMFSQLLTVSGIGPKAALGILSVLSPDELRFAVLADDARAISRAPGVGAKSAQRVILELRDRLRLEDLAPASRTETPAGKKASHTSFVHQKRAEAVEALTALGYGGSEAMGAVKKTRIDEDTTVEEILKQAFVHLAKI